MTLRPDTNGTTGTTGTGASADPVTSRDRLLEIAGYDLESPELRARLHDYARQAAERLELPVGLVSIVLDGAQFLAGMHGLEGTWIADAEGTPVEWSFCASAVRSGQAYVVEDAATDALQHDNPLVTVDGIRSYAGAPLVTEAGHVLGACCTLGYEPREFTDVEVDVLRGLSREIVEELGRHRAA